MSYTRLNGVNMGLQDIRRAVVVKCVAKQKVSRTVHIRCVEKNESFVISMAEAVDNSLETRSNLKLLYIAGGGTGYVSPSFF